jgi:CheY-like chemotaxis protein
MTFILIADDHPIAREPLARLLKHEGYETACAANGLEALEVLRGRRPDLILLDMMMPKMGGLAFLRALRQADGPGAAAAEPTEAGRAARPPAAAAAPPPVIILAAFADSSEVAHARQLGVRDVIAKARFSFDELLHRIRSHLAPDRAADPAPAPAAAAAAAPAPAAAAAAEPVPTAA